MGKIGDLLKGARSLAGGIGITVRNTTRKPVTVQYPREEAPISKAQRNAIILIPKEETGGSHNCIACLQCEKICPSNCIKIEGEKLDGITFKRPTQFDMNFALCSDCGLCIDVCPTDTLGYGKTYDAAGYERADSMHDLLSTWSDSEDRIRDFLREEEAKKKAEKEAKRKADAEAKAKADAEKKE